MYLRLIMLIIPLFKEIFLYEEEEDVMNPKSTKFDLRKALPVLITIGCIGSLFFSVDRLINITMKHIDLKDQYELLGKQYSDLKKQHEDLGHEVVELKSTTVGCNKVNQ